MNKKQLAIRYSIEFVVIVLGVLISFNIQRNADLKREKKEINDSIVTLTEEIQTNINYCDEHLNQLLNMKTVNDSILNNYYSFSKKDFVEKNDVFTVNNQAKSNKSEILVLDQMIE